MKIYTNTFDLRQPSEKKIWVPPHSDFKIGIKVIGYKQIQYEKDIWLYDGSKEIPKDSEDNDFVFFKIKSGDTGEVTYTIKIIDGPNTLGLFTLTQVVTDSTVYEQESGGEIPEILDVKSVKTQNITVANSYGINSNGGGCFNRVSVPDANVYINSEIDGISIGCITLNGCNGKGTFTSIKSDQINTDAIDIGSNYIAIQSDNGAKINLVGGCGSEAYLEIQQDAIIRIQPNPNVSTFNTLVFKPYVMQELNGGCGGYVLAAFD